MAQILDTIVWTARFYLSIHKLHFYINKNIKLDPSEPPVDLVVKSICKKTSLKLTVV